MDTLFNSDQRPQGRLYTWPARVVHRRTDQTVARRRGSAAHVSYARTTTDYLDGLVRANRSPLSDRMRHFVRPTPGLLPDATRLPTSVRHRAIYRIHHAPIYQATRCVFSVITPTAGSYRALPSILFSSLPDDDREHSRSSETNLEWFYFAFCWWQCRHKRQSDSVC